MLENIVSGGRFCNICAHEWSSTPTSPDNGAERRAPNAGHQVPAFARSATAGESSAERRFDSIEDLIAKTHIRRDELATLAEIGALNAFGLHRRSALWQIEKAIRPAGELLNDSTPSADRDSPLRPMSRPERLLADYAGTSVTIGPHPMALRRAELALRGVLRATDLPRGRHGRRVRVAGAVITRQRPGTAKGFVFLTLEDETGIANIIVQPDLFSAHRSVIVGEPYLLIEGTLQIQEGVTSVKAERVLPLTGGGPEPQSHDFR
jgi:error-prone DNA polymerase